jgi:hypothetical protein
MIMTDMGGVQRYVCVTHVLLIMNGWKSSRYLPIFVIFGVELAWWLACRYLNYEVLERLGGFGTTARVVGVKCANDVTT